MNYIIKINKEILILERIDGISNEIKSFLSTKEISSIARNIFLEFYNEDEFIENPDLALIKCIDIEYMLFKNIEKNIYRGYLSEPLLYIDNLISISNSILNRRKSRAGKSLENHVEYILKYNTISYSSQCITEGKKKPDFILPSIDSYRDLSFDKENLIFLACKTTLKDRWRQILNEADRIDTKYLLTLQSDISKNQLEEIENSNVILVMPKSTNQNENIITFKDFIEKAKIHKIK